MTESLSTADISGTSLAFSKAAFVMKKPHDGSREELGGKRWEENPSREM